MGTMITKRCRWAGEGVRCTEKATYHLIYGCLSQHMDEASYCYEHAGCWARQFEDHQLLCLTPGCFLGPEDWGYIKMDLIKKVPIYGA
jgi:hypothetical protein